VSGQVATSKKTRQGLKQHGSPVYGIAGHRCNEQENPTGIETRGCPEQRRIGDAVATSKKTRQGLKRISGIL